jgi:hypothetical protein
MEGAGSALEAATNEIANGVHSVHSGKEMFR